MKRRIYAGTYAENGSKGVYAMDFEDGTLSPANAVCALPNSKYLTVTNRALAAVCDFPEKSGAALIGFDGEIRSAAAFEDCTSCYITASGSYLYTANYHEGTVTCLSMEGGTLRLLNALQIREKAGCHQVLPWGEFLLVPCLFLDCVVILTRDLEKVGKIPFPEGTGPQHGVFSRDGKTLYLVSELSNELFALETGTWKTMFHMSVLPGGLTHKKDTAAIRLNERGDRLYVSTRTMDIVSVIGLEGASPRLLQAVPCGGKHPRDMILAGRHILTANRFTNSVVAFEIREDGTIGARTGEATVPGVVCLADAPSARDGT